MERTDGPLPAPGQDSVLAAPVAGSSSGRSLRMAAGIAVLIGLLLILIGTSAIFADEEAWLDTYTEDYATARSWRSNGTTNETVVLDVDVDSRFEVHLTQGTEVELLSIRDLEGRELFEPAECEDWTDWDQVDECNDMPTYRIGTFAAPNGTVIVSLNTTGEISFHGDADLYAAWPGTFWSHFGTTLSTSLAGWCLTCCLAPGILLFGLFSRS